MGLCFWWPAQSIIHRKPRSGLPAVNVVKHLVRTRQKVEVRGLHARMKCGSNNALL